jgi:hypothetical protein
LFFFSWKDNFEADKKKQTSLRPIAQFDPKILSGVHFFGVFWSPRGLGSLRQSGVACSMPPVAPFAVFHYFCNFSGL